MCLAGCLIGCLVRHLAECDGVETRLGDFRWRTCFFGIFLGKIGKIHHHEPPVMSRTAPTVLSDQLSDAQIYADTAAMTTADTSHALLDTLRQLASQDRKSGV